MDFESEESDCGGADTGVGGCFSSLPAAKFGADTEESETDSSRGSRQAEDESPELQPFQLAFSLLPGLTTTPWASGEPAL